MVCYTEAEAGSIARYVELYSHVQEAALHYQMAKQISLSFPATPENSALYHKAASSAKENLRKSLDLYKEEVPLEIRDKIKFGKTISELEALASC